MYIPKQFEESRIEDMHDLIRAYPLSTVVTQSSAGLNANHIPLHLTPVEGCLGVLRGHVARANPILEDLKAGAEVLAIFHGPNAYITPSWYATKAETGRVVPTWNYSVVHAYGVLKIVDNTDWLLAHLHELTSHNERHLPEQWHVSDAPADFVEKIITAIVGIEMAVTRIFGKSKISQNQPPQNQAGVISGLKTRDVLGASDMADLMAAKA